MAFSFETLTKDESNKLQEEHKFRDISNEEPVYPEWRVVDKERNAFLIALRIGEPIKVKKTIGSSRSVVRFSFFELVWHGKRTQIQCSEALNLDTNQINYTINQATADPALESKRDELIRLIEEAFVARKVEYKKQDFAFRHVDGKLGDAYENVYFDGEKMIDVSIRPKFSFKTKPADPSKPHEASTHKILVDEVYGATLERLGFSGGAEHFLLTLDGHPIYLRRTYEVWMLDARQVLWSYDRILADHELYSDKREKRTVQSKIAYDALHAWGFGDVKYLRGPSRVVKNSDMEYASKGADVIVEGQRDLDRPLEPVYAHHDTHSKVTITTEKSSPWYKSRALRPLIIILILYLLFVTLPAILKGK